MLKMSAYFLLMALPFFGYGQTLSFTSGIGYARAEMRQPNIKKLVLCEVLELSYEKHLKELPVRIRVGLAARRLEYDYLNFTGENVFDQKSFLDLPVWMARHYPISEKSGIYWAFGVNGSLLFRNRKEFRTGPSIRTTLLKGGGGSVGVQGSVGFGTRITNSIVLEISLRALNEIYTSYDRADQWIKAPRKLLHFGLAKKMK